MKTFNQFINEGIKNKMLPKSKEDIKSTLEGKPYLYIINKINKYKLDINDIFTKEEQDKMKTNDFCYIDDEEEIICFDIEQLKKIVSCVGEGIRDIHNDSKMYYPNEYQNEIYITFWENVWGGVGLSEWNELDKRLKEFEGKNGFNSYDINTENLNLRLIFDGEYPLEEL